MARDSGFSSFVDRDANSIKISLKGREETYQVLKIFYFESERRCMSVVVRHP